MSHTVLLDGINRNETLPNLPNLTGANKEARSSDAAATDTFSTWHEVYSIDLASTAGPWDVSTRTGYADCRLLEGSEDGERGRSASMS